MKISLTRRYLFSAAHRLHSARFSDAENRRLYGKCDNPHGHGHNYSVEVTLTGPVDPKTGMVANLAELDEFVQREILDPFDHKNLNEEVAEFRNAVPTTENLAHEIFRRLRSFSGARLERIRIEETGKNSFECFEDPGARVPGEKIR
ncbi:MAG: 6-carboxytetrahydropterin synthase [Candidatus Acidiferrales bacterium]